MYIYIYYFRKKRFLIVRENVGNSFRKYVTYSI